MKTWMMALALTLSPLYSSATCSDSHTAAEETQVVQKEGVTNIAVSGMSCSRCVKNVEGMLEALTVPKDVSIKVTVNNIAIDHSKAKISQNEVETVRSNIETILAKSKYKIVTGS